MQLKKHPCKIIYFFIGLLLLVRVYASTDESAAVEGLSANPPAEGNFALPVPSQPGPLLSFGQTLIGRNHIQVAMTSFSPYHVGGAFDNLDATMTYGITDSTSFYFDYPLRTDALTRAFRSAHLMDVTLQLEQAFYTSGTASYQDQATVVGAITLPTNDVDARVRRHNGQFGQISYGVPSYFFGATYNYTSIDWMFFTSPGVLLTVTSDHIRLGSQYYYQGGIGRNILAVKDKSILFALLELDGQYTQHDLVFQTPLPNTGGNVIALTPSLSLATEQFIAQVGVGFPVVQQLNGNQQNIRYFIAANFTWTVA